MSQRPYIICLMVTSIDGRLHPSRFTASPDGARKDWSAAYETLHEKLAGDAWLVGRVTFAEMAKGEPHPPGQFEPVERPFHIARRGAAQYAVGLDPSGKVHFHGPEIAGDPAVVLLGGGVPDSHLAELARDGVSYIVSERPEVDLDWALGALRGELGIKRLVLEGGATINGAFLAAGLVDELHVVIAPALDGGTDVEGIVAYGDGLAGHVRLSLRGCDQLGHGVVHLHYQVLPA